MNRGRPPLREGQAKTERINLRVSPALATWLDSARGTTSRTAYVTEVLRQVAAGELIPVQTVTTGVTVIEPVSATPAPTMAQTVPSVARVANPSRTVAEPVSLAHLHRRGALIGTEWVKGVQVKTYACVVEGCPATLGGS